MTVRSDLTGTWAWVRSGRWTMLTAWSVAVFTIALAASIVSSLFFADPTVPDGWVFPASLVIAGAASLASTLGVGMYLYNESKEEAT